MACCSQGSITTPQALVCFCPENQTGRRRSLSLVLRTATTLTTLFVTTPPRQLLGEMCDQTEGSAPRCTSSNLTVGCCHHSLSCCGQLCPLFVQLVQLWGERITG